DARGPHCRPITDAVHALNLGFLLRGGPNNLVQDISNHFVADRGNADLLSRANKVDDHPRTGEGFACTGWSLDGKNTAVECEDDPTRRGNRRLSKFAQCGPRDESRFEMKQEVACSAEGTGAVNTVIANELPEAQ